MRHAPLFLLKCGRFYQHNEVAHTCKTALGILRTSQIRLRTMATEQQPRTRNKTIGAFGESVVADFIASQGTTIVDRNWRIKEGEIDIVAQLSDGSFAFVEVKTRTSLTYGHPLESINSAKAHRLQRLALAWLATHQSLGHEYRIDCAAVIIATSGKFTIEYRKNVL